ncbi:MAG: bactofilin family protein [Bdellovibrionota bacterium]
MEWQAIPGRQLESEVTLLSQGSLIKGDLTFDQMTRLHGRVEGRIVGLAGSVIVIGETASVHGEILGDEIIIDGFVHGNVTATTKITLSESGRLLGNVKCPKFEVKFGAHFEGRALTSAAPTGRA